MTNTADTPDNVWEISPSIVGVGNTGFTIRDVTDSRNCIVIDGTGKVGINTSAPSEKIHIADGNLRLKSSNTSGYKVKIGNAATGDDDFLGAVSGFWNENEVAIVGFRSGTDTTNKDDGIIFFGTSESGSNPSTHMTIRESGNVGIGTASPSSVLHVDTGLSGAPLVTFHQTNGASSADAGLEVETSSTGTYIQRWINSGDEKMRVTGNGEVGIGTTSMSGQLNVQCSAGAVALEATDATNSTFRISHPSSGIVLLGSGNGQHIAFGSNFTEQIRMDSSGRLLIGTESSLSFNGVGQNHNLIVAGSTTDTNILNNSGAALTISNTDGTANNTAGLHFAREDTDGAPHYNGASIVAQFKETMNTGHYPKAQLAFLTSSANNNAPTEKYRITSMGSLTTAQSSQSVIGRDWTSGSVAAGTTVNWNGSGADAANSKLNFNSIGGNGGGHITCLSVSSQDQQPSGAMIITGVHGSGFNSYVTHASNFDSGISVTFNGTVTIQNTSSETIYYAVNVIHLGTGNTTYLGR
tara:strand:- start:328 stop:1899 length:1572 start_codon:yes stop_codon:yes gene_type:complete